MVKRAIRIMIGIGTHLYFGIGYRHLRSGVLIRVERNCKPLRHPDEFSKRVSPCIIGSHALRVESQGGGKAHQRFGVLRPSGSINAAVQPGVQGSSDY
jgi:hypothetical protein